MQRSALHWQLRGRKCSNRAAPHQLACVACQQCYDFLTFELQCLLQEAHLLCRLCAQMQVAQHRAKQMRRITAGFQRLSRATEVWRTRQAM